MEQKRKEVSLQTNQSVFIMHATQQQIIEKAFALFMTDGYKEVTLSRLLKATGLSKGGFYHYFESKEALFEQVVEQFFFGVASNEGFQPLPEKNFIENMDLFLEQKEMAFKLFAQQLGVEQSEINFFMFIMHAITNLPGARQKTELFMQQEKRQLENIIALAREKGEIRDNIEPTFLAEMLMRLFDGTEMHGVLLHENFLTLERERRMIRELYNWIKTQND